jgi:hypothetical protein
MVRGKGAGKSKVKIEYVKRDDFKSQRKFIQAQPLVVHGKILWT